MDPALATSNGRSKEAPGFCPFDEARGAPGKLMVQKMRSHGKVKELYVCPCSKKQRMLVNRLGYSAVCAFCNIVIPATDLAIAAWKYENGSEASNRK
jgi:hypothetical protein